MEVNKGTLHLYLKRRLYYEMVSKGMLEVPAIDIWKFL
jgi:hypothetical protein